MLGKILNYIEKIREKDREKLRDISRAKFEETARKRQRETIADARNKISSQPTTSKKRNKIPYKEFKTVLEMAFVATKARQAKEKWTHEQQEEFDKKFAVNLEKCLKNPRFKKDYELYLELENGTAIPKGNPQTLKEKAINQMHGKILDICFALSPDFADDEKYRAIRFKYEKKLDDNKKESELEKNAEMKKRHIISI